MKKARSFIHGDPWGISMAALCLIEQKETRSYTHEHTNIKPERRINFCPAHTLPVTDQFNGRKSSEIFSNETEARHLVMKDEICRQEMCNTAALVLLRLVVCGGTKEMLK